MIRRSSSDAEGQALYINSPATTLLSQAATLVSVREKHALASCCCCRRRIPLLDASDDANLDPN